MRIETKNLNSNIIHTAILIHAIVVVAAPAISIGFIMFIGKRMRHVNPDQDFFYQSDSLITYIILFSIIGIGIATGIIYRVNYKKKFMVAIEFKDEEQKAIVYYKTFYNNKIRSEEIPYEGIHLQQQADALPYIDNSLDQFEDKRINIYNSGNYSCEIPIGGSLWDKEGAKIKMIRNKITAINKS